MESITYIKLGIALDTLSTQNKEWLNKTHYYCDEIKIFLHSINCKAVACSIGLQIRKDVIFNLDTMMKRIYRDGINKLEDDEELLSKVLTLSKPIAFCDHQYREDHAGLMRQMRSIEKSMNQLRRMVKRFLKNEFGVYQEA